MVWTGLWGADGRVWGRPEGLERTGEGGPSFGGSICELVGGVDGHGARGRRALGSDATLRAGAGSGLLRPPHTLPLRPGPPRGEEPGPPLCPARSTPVGPRCRSFQTVGCFRAMKQKQNHPHFLFLAKWLGSLAQGAHDDQNVENHRLLSGKPARPPASQGTLLAPRKWIWKHT